MLSKYLLNESLSSEPRNPMDLPLAAEADPPPLSDEAEPAFIGDLLMNSPGHLLNKGMPILMSYSSHPSSAPIPTLREVGVLE